MIGDKRGGYLKLWRSLLTWRWYHDQVVTRLFVHLVLTVDYKRTATSEAGTRCTSIAELVAETGLTTQQVRTALDKLHGTQDIVMRSTKAGRSIALRRWAFWQFDAVDQQTGNKAINDPGNKAINDRINKGRTRGTPTAPGLPFDAPQGSTIPATIPTTIGSTDRSTNNKRRRGEEGEELPIIMGRVLAHRPQLRIEKGESNNATPGSARPPRERTDIDQVLDALRRALARLGINSLDSSEADNRRAAHTLLQRIRRDYPQVDTLAHVEQLIATAMGDHKFHRLNCTNVRYLVNNAEKLRQLQRSTTGAPLNGGDPHSLDQLTAILPTMQDFQIERVRTLTKNPAALQLIDQEQQRRQGRTA